MAPHKKWCYKTFGGFVFFHCFGASGVSTIDLELQILKYRNEFCDTKRYTSEGVRVTLCVANTNPQIHKYTKKQIKIQKNKYTKTNTQIHK